MLPAMLPRAHDRVPMEGKRARLRKEMDGGHGGKFEWMGLLRYAPTEICGKISFTLYETSVHLSPPVVHLVPSRDGLTTHLRLLSRAPEDSHRVT